MCVCLSPSFFFLGFAATWPFASLKDTPKANLNAKDIERLLNQQTGGQVVSVQSVQEQNEEMLTIQVHFPASLRFYRRAHGDA